MQHGCTPGIRKAGDDELKAKLRFCSPLPAFLYGDEIDCFVHYLTDDLIECVLPHGQKSEVCGKFKPCRAHRNAATLLPAASFREKAGSLGGARICRILPCSESGSAG